MLFYLWDVTMEIQYATERKKGIWLDRRILSQSYDKRELKQIHLMLQCFWWIKRKVLLNCCYFPLKFNKWEGWFSLVSVLLSADSSGSLRITLLVLLKVALPLEVRFFQWKVSSGNLQKIEMKWTSIWLCAQYSKYQVQEPWSFMKHPGTCYVNSTPIVYVA